MYSMKKIIITILLIILIPSAILTTFFVNRLIDHPIKRNRSLRWLKEEQYIPSLGLCRASPEVEPNTVWIMNDNLLASLVLCNIDLTGYEQYLNVGLPIEILVYGIVLSPPFNGSTDIIIEIRDGYTIKTEVPSGELMDDWNEYANLLAYGILSYHYSGEQELATEYFQELCNMWDGVGFVDKPFENSSEYQTYKNALFIIVAKTLGYKGPLVCGVNDAIYRCYRKGGGFYTGYFNNGSIQSDANTETTSLVLLAYERGVMNVIRRE